MPRVLVLPGWVATSGHGVHTPDHKAFGVSHFHERGYEPVVFDRPVRPASKRRPHMPTRHGVPLAGDIRPQLTAWVRQRDIDLVYAPWSQRYALLLRYLRAGGLLRRPIVCLIHSPLAPKMTHGAQGLAARVALRGTDGLPCITSGVARQISALGWHSDRVSVATLGPDAAFYPAPEEPGEGFVAAGISWRDLELFGLAATEAAVPATIVCRPGDISPAFAAFGDNVRIVGPMAYERLLPLYRSARALAVPLKEVHYQRGIWGLFDGLASSKPVIMTRTSLVDVDLEGDGVGISVPPGDKEAWVTALRRLHDDPDEAVQMGRRGRALVDDGLNSRTFAHRLMDLFDSILGIDTRA